MLDLPGQPILDKLSLIGGCLRLPLVVDADALRQEVSVLAPSLWGTTGGRIGVHSVAEALFLRGYAPIEGNLPIEDRPVLDALPITRSIIEGLFSAEPQRCLLARLPAGSVVAAHIDQAPYFGQTLRVHIPIETNESVFMVASNLSYTMRAGEVWVLNNSEFHSVWNAHASLSRTHLICDFLPSDALLGLLARGDRYLGVNRPEVDQHIGSVRDFDAAPTG